MAEKFKKVDKEYVLSDSTVNCYGYRLLTSGYQLAEYAKNPIGYYMHLREDGVVVRWEDLRIEGDTVYGKPCINLSNKRGDQTLNEAETGFLNAASVGHIVVIEYSIDAADMVAGQTGPTVTKWFNRETSLVDIPGNSNALTSLYDNDGNALKLADLMAKPNEKHNNKNLNSRDMNEIKLSLTDLAALKENGYDITDAAGLLARIKADKLKAEVLTAENLNLKNDKASLEVKIDTLRAEHTQKEVEGMLETALKAGKITAPIKTQLASVYAGKPDLLKIDLDARTPYVSIANNLGNDGAAPSGDEYSTYQKLSWDEMHKTNKLPALKGKYPDLYKEKYKSKYGTYPSA